VVLAKINAIDIAPGCMPIAFYCVMSQCAVLFDYVYTTTMRLRVVGIYAAYTPSAMIYRSIIHIVHSPLANPTFIAAIYLHLLIALNYNDVAAGRTHQINNNTTYRLIEQLIRVRRSCLGS